MEEALTIERLSYGPMAIAHSTSGKTVFVLGAVPGDICEVEVVKSEKRFDIAHIKQLLQASPHREEHPKFDVVLAQAPWGNVAYDEQLKAKRANLIDALTRIGHFDLDYANEHVAACIPSTKPWNYRNKIELSIRKDTARPLIGVVDVHGDISPVKVDPLFNAPTPKTIKALTGAVSYLLGSKDVALDRIGIRYSEHTKEFEIALWGPSGPFPRSYAAKILSTAFETQPSSIVRVMQKGPRASRKIAGTESLYGRGSWGEVLNNNHMRVSAASFFQVNTQGAEALINLVVEGLKPKKDDVVTDLFCGAGTFSIPLAQMCSWVYAVESFGPAVKDLRRNINAAQLNTIEAIGGDSSREIDSLDSDLIVCDPPRAGLGEALCCKLSQSRARTIAYVSCDPATLARDLHVFAKQGTYTLNSITPVDLFPQTYHVETVVLMSRVKD